MFASGNAGKFAELQALLAPTGIVLVPRSEFGLESPEETGLSFLENALLKARHAAEATGLPAIADDSGLAVDALGGAPGVRSARFAADARSARSAHISTGLPAIADDSSPAVDALGGAPKVRSAQPAVGTAGLAADTPGGTPDAGSAQPAADAASLAADTPGGTPDARFAQPAAGGAAADANVARLLEEMQDVADTRRGARFCCVVVALARWDDPMPLVGSGQWRGRITRQPRGAGGFGYDPVFFDPDLGATAAELPAEVKNRVSHRGQALAQIEQALRLTCAAPGMAC